MMDEPLHYNECYICLQQCKTESPCLCKSYVHKECLETFLAKSHNELCTICKSEYYQKKPTMSTQDKCVRFISCSIVCFVIWLFLGMVGQWIAVAMHMTTSIDPLGSESHTVAALVTVSVCLVFVIVCVLTRRNILYTSS